MLVKEEGGGVVQFLFRTALAALSKTAPLRAQLRLMPLVTGLRRVVVVVVVQAVCLR